MVPPMAGTPVSKSRGEEQQQDASVHCEVPLGTYGKSRSQRQSVQLSQLPNALRKTTLVFIELPLPLLRSSPLIATRRHLAMLARDCKRVPVLSASELVFTPPRTA